MVGSRPKVVVLGVAMIALAAWKQGKRGLLLAALLAGIALPAQAVEPSALTPLTKLQLSVVQWNPVLGQYQKLDAVSGEITVAPDHERSGLRDLVDLPQEVDIRPVHFGHPPQTSGANRFSPSGSSMTTEMQVLAGAVVRTVFDVAVVFGTVTPPRSE